MSCPQCGTLKAKLARVRLRHAQEMQDQIDTLDQLEVALRGLTQKLDAIAKENNRVSPQTHG